MSEGAVNITTMRDDPLPARFNQSSPTQRRTLGFLRTKVNIISGRTRKSVVSLLPLPRDADGKISCRGDFARMSWHRKLVAPPTENVAYWPQKPGKSACFSRGHSRKITDSLRVETRTGAPPEVVSPSGRRILHSL